MTASRLVSIATSAALAFGALVVSGATPAAAASIGAERHPFEGREVMMIVIKGELRSGDERTFIRRALEFDEAVVMLDSPGGDLSPGIEIGKVIRLKGFTTLVRKGRSCESACALAWLAGVPALMESNGTVGFHAVWEDTDEGGISSVGNAVVGAYVNALGLPQAVVEYVTEADPEDMKYLTFADALKIGLPVKRYVPKPVATAPVTDGKPAKAWPLATAP